MNRRLQLALPPQLLAEPAFSAWAALIVYCGVARPRAADPARSDHDLLAIAVPPREFYFGLREFGSREARHGQWDAVAHEARKAVRLLVNGNPNLLEALYAAPEHRALVRPAGRLLFEQRDLFSRATPPMGLLGSPARS